MSYSVKMAKLDFYTLKAQFGNYIALILIIAMFCFMGSSIITLSITAAWFTALLMTNIFVKQEKNDLERLYASLSLDLKNIICGRYIFIFANFVAVLIISIIIGVCALFFQNSTVSFMEIITAVCVSLLIFTIIIGVQIPIYFRYGYTKAKIRCLIPYILVLGIVVLPSFTEVFSSIFVVAMKHQSTMNAVCLLLSVVTTLISYRTSINCYKKRK